MLIALWILKSGKPQEIFKLARLVVFNRPCYIKKNLIIQKEKIEMKFNTSIKFLDIIDLEISSSMIRQRISEGKRVDFFLSKEVLNYIKENNIYNYCNNIKL